MTDDAHFEHMWLDMKTLTFAGLKLIAFLTFLHDGKFPIVQRFDCFFGIRFQNVS